MLLTSWLIAAVFTPDRGRRNRRLGRTPWLLLGGALLWLTSRHLLFTGAGGEVLPVAWPWYAPLGGLTAFAFGYLLADRAGDAPPPPRRDGPEEPSPFTARPAANAAPAV